MEKKYELTEKTITFEGKNLYRIKSLKDFNNIKAGEIGGYVENESNLSHEGNCWIYDNAVVRGNAKVIGDARISGNSLVCGKARVYENARIYGYAKVYDDALIYGEAEIFGKAIVCGDAEVYYKAKVYENATVKENALVCGYAKIYGSAEVKDRAKVYENAQVCESACVCGYAHIRGNAFLEINRNIITFYGVGDYEELTGFRTVEGYAISFSSWMFMGTLQEFLLKVEKVHGNDKCAKELKTLAEVIRIRFEE